MKFDENVLSKIDPEKVIGFLSSAGWKNQDPDNTEVYRYIHEDGGMLIIPTSSRVPRYSKSISNVISTISEWEDTDETRVFQQIVTPNADSLVFSFRGEAADKGSFPLSWIQDAAKYIKDSIKYSACGELQPSPYYVGIKRQAREISERARFGQTGIGSFVISVLLPHSVNSTKAEPIERGVMKRIITGTKQAKKCVLQGKDLDYDTAYKTGLNANLAESLAQLRFEGLTISMSALWDRQIPISNEFHSSVEVGERTFDFFDRISSGYRSETSEENVHIKKAKVIGLSWDDNENDESESDTPYIDVKVNDPSSLSIKKFRVSLGQEDYRIACDAHITSKEISIRGRLSKYKSRWWMRKYSNFSII